MGTVIALVAVELAGSPTSLPTAGTDRWNAARQRLQLQAVVDVAALIATEIGRPDRSVMRWIFDPFLPRSTGFGPVSSPPLAARTLKEPIAHRDQSGGHIGMVKAMAVSGQARSRKRRRMTALPKKRIERACRWAV
jgi:hypothetical protein